MIRNLPPKWDLEADVVSVGSGIGGLAAAITAQDQGLRALILERSPQVGGVTALSLGEVWVAGNHLARALGIEDSPEAGYRHLKRISMGYGDDVAILNKVIHARIALKYFEEKIGLKMRVLRNFPEYYWGVLDDGLPEGRMLECEPFPAATLGEWQGRTRVSPQVPYGMTHDDMYERGGPANMAKWDYVLMGERLANDERCLGPGLAAYFVKGALDRNIRIDTGVNVRGLIGDGNRVVGVLATKDEKDIYIKATRGVLIATSSYERNAKFNKTLGTQINLETMMFPSIDGASFRLAGPFGARIAKVPDVTLIGFQVPGEENEDGEPLWRVGFQAIGVPHSICVNRQGKRFGNEAFYRGFGYAVDFIDGNTQTHPNVPCWAIFDSQAREKYPIGSIMPGEELPQGFGVKADSIRELAAKVGIDSEGLAATIVAFNANCEKGVDPEFHRGSHPWSVVRGDPFHKPSPNLGPLSKPPYYALELHRLGGSGIPSTGLVTDHHSRVIGWDDKPIEGLYAAGNAVARMDTGAGMQSGVSNARGMTHGYLASLHAAGKPSELLQKEIARLGMNELKSAV